MSKNINLNSEEWRDLVFEGKNKSYGAYRLRQSSSKRHIVAFMVVFLFAVLVASLPALMSAVKDLTKGDAVEMGPMDQIHELSKIPVEPEIPKENLIKQIDVPPPPELKSTVKFDKPVIAKDEEVQEVEIASQSELQETRTQISVADIVGTDEEHGIDIAELREHKQIVQAEPEEEGPVLTPDHMPEFPGGMEAMQKFIRDNLKYPPLAKEAGVQGRVVLRFVVTKDGDVSNIEVLRSVDPSCDREATRVVKGMPKWIPGKQGGRNVAVYFQLPIVFKITD